MKKLLTAEMLQNIKEKKERIEEMSYDEYYESLSYNDKLKLEADRQEYEYYLQQNSLDRYI
jgi:hypothetical protein